jgi:hypothetical protein
MLIVGAVVNNHCARLFFGASGEQLSPGAALAAVVSGLSPGAALAAVVSGSRRALPGRRGEQLSPGAALTAW